jgi:novobiocin biosynthesis protein NovU/D-mycarose 3-C-methyltransferase
VRRTSCSGCGSSELNTFLNLGESPIADAYTAHPAGISPTFPLDVAVCGKCRLIQLLEVVDHKTLFGTGYSFYSSASAPLSAYHQQYAAEVMRRHPTEVLHGVLEVGCNDGDMLRHFAAKVFPALGVDPAEGPASVARNRGLWVDGRPFSLAVAQDIRKAHQRGYGIVIANHVLAHVEDVADVLCGIGSVLADDGVAYIEVQYAPDLLVNNAFDLVYHEHRNFFSLQALKAAATVQGLLLTDAWLTDRQGGSLRVALRVRSNQTQEQYDRVGRILDSERWLNSDAAYEGMQGRAERIRARLLNLIADEKTAGRRVAGYGAPAKATTLLNFCGITSMLDHVVDTTEAKQGRYIPGTRIPIVAPPGPDADTYVLLAWNYAGPIMRNNPGHRWIVPIPAPVLL